MSQHRTKKPPEAKDKASFFTARAQQNKNADTSVQDGAESDTDGESLAGMAVDKPTLQHMLDSLAHK
ncbi:Hypothetical predicted protein, partial [Pelobates cultripes]